MIKPTIGRVVLFYFSKDQAEPTPALICKVHNERMINIGGFNEIGMHTAASSVPLLQDDDAAPEFGYYATWMPYQIEKAAEETMK